MSIRSLIFAIGVAIAFAACGPSSAQIKEARTARYQAPASEVFQATVEALKSNDHKIKAADPIAGNGITVERWYEVDGTYLSRDSDGRPLMSGNGGILFAIEFRVAAADGSNFKVDLIPRVLRARDGYSVPDELKPDDPAMPGWVHGKLDNVYVSLHGALKGRAAPAAP